MTENVIHKNGVYDFNVTTQEDKPLQKSVFYTQDSGGTARLIFNIDKDNQDLVLSSAAELELAMILAVGKESESKYLVKPTVVDGVRGSAEYTLTDSQIAHDGNAIAELYIKYKNSQAMRVYKFEFEIKKALIDSDFFPVKEYYVERWDDYEKIFDESFERLNAKLDDVDKKADDLKTQFDAMQPAQFAQKTDLNAHVNNADIHVTATDKTSWNAKETTASAQAKADKALADAKAFFELSSEVQSVNLTPKNGFIATQPLVARYVKFGTRFLVLIGGIVGKGTGTGIGVCASVPSLLAPDTAWNKLFSASQQSSSANNRANVYISSGGDISVVAAGDVTVNTGLDCVIYFTKEVTT
ncbi:BppU family phage baseplate upper protein [Listeria monocytogenes]|nr:BppU family phage baseplate upper protein [Listeria monocytogenes]EKZ0917451.1 BppU family phage baseplate upper protein [Listeria monocytogenes]EKZ0972606.1 BppU family phage baseplate upper protein [Listeria monocytogenes]EKZ0981386.1 BppU family phage baseplate upper protein [Listeria monocytogenes]EKZ0990126.1 BppU family phage baseplate upper protein [Listeria monocytogenes]